MDKYHDINAEDVSSSYSYHDASISVEKDRNSAKTIFGTIKETVGITHDKVNNYQCCIICCVVSIIFKSAFSYLDHFDF